MKNYKLTSEVIPRMNTVWRFALSRLGIERFSWIREFTYTPCWLQRIRTSLRWIGLHIFTFPFEGIETAWQSYPVVDKRSSALSFIRVMNAWPLLFLKFSYGSLKLMPTPLYWSDRSRIWTEKSQKFIIHNATISSNYWISIKLSRKTYY